MLCESLSVRPSFRPFIRAWLCVLLGCMLAGGTQAASMPLDERQITHLLQRTGFGGTEHAYAAFTGLDREAAVDRIVSGLTTHSTLPMPGWVSLPAPRFFALGDLGASERQQFRQRRDLELAELRQWWFAEMLVSDSPQTERLVLFWHDLFATSYHGIARQSIALARQNRTFRQLGSGNWRVLLKAMLRDVALLNYLNNNQNRKAHPNENLARELLELFTLGEGHYSEQDVREAARALTGYHVAPAHDLGFRLATWQQDTGEKTLFGQTGAFDGDDLIDRILEQPAAARFLATRFWQAFVSDTAPEETIIAQWAEAFRASDYDITSLYRKVLLSDAFWDERHRHSIIRSPVQLLVGTARTLGYPGQAMQGAPALSAAMGMDLFAPPNVAGWREGRAFVAPGLLDQREQAMTQWLRAALPERTDGTAVPMMMAADGASMLDSRSQSRLQLHLAGEAFQGNPDFRVVLGAGDAARWHSVVMTLPLAHDTERFGRVRSPLDLPWYSMDIDAPASIVGESDWIDIEYLNDAAGAGGDRNLYVAGLSVDGQWIASDQGRQRSGCVPKQAHNAGRLYCDGQLRLALPARAASDADNDDAPERDFTATAIRTGWGNVKPGGERSDFAFYLENLAAPPDLDDDTVYTLGVRLIQRDGDGIQLRLERHACWPDCVVVWPDCAWRSQVDGRPETLTFPWPAATGTALACHRDGLRELDRQRIGALWTSLPDLLERLRTMPRGSRFETVIAHWQTLLQQHRVAQPGSDHGYAVGQRRVRIVEDAGREPVALPWQPPPLPAHAARDPRTLSDSEGETRVRRLLPALPAGEVGRVATLGEGIGSDAFAAYVARLAVLQVQ